MREMIFLCKIHVKTHFSSNSEIIYFLKEKEFFFKYASVLVVCTKSRFCSRSFLKNIFFIFFATYIFSIFFIFHIFFWEVGLAACLACIRILVRMDWKPTLLGAGLPVLVGWKPNLFGSCARPTWTVGRKLCPAAHMQGRGRRWTIVFQVWRNVYLLVPLGKGGRGDDPCRGGVVNGGLWLLEEVSKGAGLALQLLSPSLLPCRRLWLSCDCRGEACGGD